jgi:hypothetical protein
MGTAFNNLLRASAIVVINFGLNLIFEKGEIITFKDGICGSVIVKHEKIVRILPMKVFRGSELRLASIMGKTVLTLIKKRNETPIILVKLSIENRFTALIKLIFLT